MNAMQRSWKGRKVDKGWESRVKNAMQCNAEGR